MLSVPSSLLVVVDYSCYLITNYIPEVCYFSVEDQLWKQWVVIFQLGKYATHKYPFIFLCKYTCTPNRACLSFFHKLPSNMYVHQVQNCQYLKITLDLLIRTDQPRSFSYFYNFIQKMLPDLNGLDCVVISRCTVIGCNFHTVILMQVKDRGADWGRKGIGGIKRR